MKYWIVFRIFESIAEKHTKNNPNQVRAVISILNQNPNNSYPVTPLRF